MIAVLHRLGFSLFGMALLTACASPPTRYYALSPTQETLAGSPSAVTVAVGPVSIPEAVNRSEMVVQLRPNQVALDEVNQWVAPLQAEIQRILMENLARLLGTSGVGRFPRGSLTDPAFRVQVEVLRFESALGEAAFLDALWTVRGKSEKEVKSGRTTAREVMRDHSYDGLAAAHSRALGTLSRDLAEAILILER